MLRAALLTALALGTLTSAARAAEVDRPAFSFLRQDEDWSVLRDVPPAERTGRFDAIKFVPLSDDGSRWASFGGTLRLRGESWSGFGFGAPPVDSDTFLLGRALGHVDLHLGDRWRLFVELKAANATDRDLPGGKRTIDVDAFDLQQGFVDVRLFDTRRDRVTLRLGRQALSFGRQRLVSPLPWANSLRSWDGIDLRWQRGSSRLDLFWSQFAPTLKYDFNEPDSDTRFAGAHLNRVGESGVVTEGYLYSLQIDRDVAFNGTVGTEERYTLGLRAARPVAIGRLEIEAAGQFGSLGGEAISAWMATAELGVDLSRRERAPRLTVGIDYASGDDASGGRVGTFRQLFPLGHAFLGILDVAGRQNVIDGRAELALVPAPRWRAVVAVHALRRAEAADALYNPGGGVVIDGAPAGGSAIGTELDGLLRFSMDAATSIEVGAAYLFADLDTEPGEDISFAYLQLEHRF